MCEFPTLMVEIQYSGSKTKNQLPCGSNVMIEAGQNITVRAMSVGSGNRRYSRSITISRPGDSDASSRIESSSYFMFALFLLSLMLNAY